MLTVLGHSVLALYYLRNLSWFFVFPVRRGFSSKPSLLFLISWTLWYELWNSCLIRLFSSCLLLVSTSFILLFTPVLSIFLICFSVVLCLDGPLLLSLIHACQFSSYYYSIFSFTCVTRSIFASVLHSVFALFFSPSVPIRLVFLFPLPSIFNFNPVCYSLRYDYFFLLLFPPIPSLSSSPLADTTRPWSLMASPNSPNVYFILSFPCSLIRPFPSPGLSAPLYLALPSPARHLSGECDRCHRRGCHLSFPFSHFGSPFSHGR